MSYAKVVNGASEHQFGYTTMTRSKTGWRVVLTGVGHRIWRIVPFPGERRPATKLSAESSRSRGGSYNEHE